MASDTLIFYNQAFVDKVKTAASSSLEGDELASFNTKIAAEETLAANLNIHCAIDRTGGNTLKVICADLEQANSTTESTYANRSRSMEQEMYSRAFEIVNRGKPVHYFIGRPSLSQMAGLGAIKYAMNYASSNNSLSNLTIWHHPQINKINGSANTIHDLFVHANRTFGVKLQRFRFVEHPTSSNALSQSFGTVIKSGDIIVQGANYQQSDSDWDSYYKKIRYGHNHWRYALGGYWPNAHARTGFDSNNMYEFYGSYMERKIIGVSSSGSSYPHNDMVAGMKAAMIGGESNTAMISLATTWTNDYSPSDTFQVNPNTAVPVEKIGGVSFASNSNFLAITSNNEMITTDDEPADYSVFINKDNL